MVSIIAYDADTDEEITSISFPTSGKLLPGQTAATRRVKLLMSEESDTLDDFTLCPSAFEENWLVNQLFSGNPIPLAIREMSAGIGATTNWEAPPEQPWVEIGYNTSSNAWEYFILSRDGVGVDGVEGHGGMIPGSWLVFEIRYTAPEEAVTSSSSFILGVL